MTKRDNILQELSELDSTLANITPQNVYTVPAGYFDGLATQVLGRIKAIEASAGADELDHLSPYLRSLSKKMPFTVPQGYFDGLTQRAIHSITENNNYQTVDEELAAISPLLSGMTKEMPYSVPQGYFESLTQKTTVESKSVTKVVSITSRKWFRYAAAAVVTGLIIMSGFLFLDGKKQTKGKALAKFTRDVKKMDETQKVNLIEFIDAGMTGNETAKEKPAIKSVEVATLLEGVSDEELKDFQQQTEDIEGILMTN